MALPGTTADRLTSMTGNAWPINPVCPWCGGTGVATVMGVAVDDCCHPFGSAGAQPSPE